MMFEPLYHYFIQHKKLYVPGIGTFLLERTPARVNFPDRCIDSPVYYVALKSGGEHARDFFSWLAEILHISDREAVVRFNDFVFDLKKKVVNEGDVEWKGMGKLSKGLAGEIKFEESPIRMIFNSPVHAEKLIRQNAEHAIRVGEEQRTSVQMTELLNRVERKKTYWWAWPLLIGLILLMFIGWYFSQYGVDPTASANKKPVKAMESSSTYKQLR